MATATRELLMTTLREYARPLSTSIHWRSKQIAYSNPENSTTLRLNAVPTRIRFIKTSYARAPNSWRALSSLGAKYVSWLVCDKKATLATEAILTYQKEALEDEVGLSADDASIVKLLVQYLYEAEYNPIFSTSTASTNKGNRNSPQTASHTCANEADHDDWGNRNQCSWVCPHHCCGRQCHYTCVEFLCDKCISVEADASQLLIHSQMYEIADKYDVIGLKSLSMEKFWWACMKFWDQPEFTQAAYHAYTTTPDDDKGLRSAVSQTVSNHMSLLLKPEVEGLMVEFNGLSFDLLMAKARQAGWCNE